MEELTARVELREQMALYLTEQADRYNLNEIPDRLLQRLIAIQNAPTLMEAGAIAEKLKSSMDMHCLASMSRGEGWMTTPQAYDSLASREEGYSKRIEDRTKSKIHLKTAKHYKKIAERLRRGETISRDERM